MSLLHPCPLHSLCPAPARPSRALSEPCLEQTMASLLPAPVPGAQSDARVPVVVVVEPQAQLCLFWSHGGILVLAGVRSSGCGRPRRAGQ